MGVKCQLTINTHIPIFTELHLQASQDISSPKINAPYCVAIDLYVHRNLDVDALKNYLPLFYLNLLYIIVNVIGLDVPPTSFVLVSDISCTTLVNIPDVFVEIVTGTNITLFQFADFLFDLYIAETNPEILLNVYVFVDEE